MADKYETILNRAEATEQRYTKEMEKLKEQAKIDDHIIRDNLKRVELKNEVLVKELASAKQSVEDHKLLIRELQVKL